jgi:hypothetical protein
MISAIAVVATGVIAGPIMSDSPPALASGTYDVMSSTEKQSVLWDIMEDFVPVVEDTWVESLGHYETDTFGVWQARGEANIAAIYATLLTKSNQSSFAGVDRDDMEGRLSVTIQHIADQNRHLDAGGNWGQGGCIFNSVGDPNCNAYVNPSTAEPFAWAVQLWWSELSQATTTF